MPPLLKKEGPPRNFAMTFGIGKLERCGYPAAPFRQYIYDRQTALWHRLRLCIASVHRLCGVTFSKP